MFHQYTCIIIIQEKKDKINRKRVVFFEINVDNENYNKYTQLVCIQRHIYLSCMHENKFQNLTRRKTGCQHLIS